MTTPSPEGLQEPALNVTDWLNVARLAGEHGIRYRTNRALEQFISALPPFLSTPPVPHDKGLRDALEPFAAIKMGDDADCRVEIVPNGYSDPSDWRRHIKRAREALSPPQQAATDEGVGQ